MMSKQKRLFILCAAVFAVLLVVYFAVIRPLTKTEETKETQPLETLPGEDGVAEAAAWLIRSPSARPPMPSATRASSPWAP